MNLDRKINSNKTKDLLTENEFKKLQSFSSSHFKWIIGVGNGEQIYFWKSKRLSDERINSITASNYSITPELSCYGSKIRVKFNGSCSKQDKITYNHGMIGQIYVVYEINKNFNISTLENCSSVAATLTINDDIDECKYIGYGIGFDKKEEF